MDKFIYIFLVEKPNGIHLIMAGEFCMKSSIIIRKNLLFTLVLLFSFAISNYKKDSNCLLEHIFLFARFMYVKLEFVCGQFLLYTCFVSGTIEQNNIFSGPRHTHWFNWASGANDHRRHFQVVMQDCNYRYCQLHSIGKQFEKLYNVILFTRWSTN